MLFPFSKYAGCGNDFVLFDNMKEHFPAHNQPLISRLCDRRLGIGADGVILLEKSSVADFKMRIFNADGSEAEMCGNGIRCLMKFIQKAGYSVSCCRIETMERVLNISSHGNDVCVEMGQPTELRWSIPLEIDGNSFEAHHLDTGVPHVILFMKDIHTVNLNTFGPKVRFHEEFSPRGANCNVVSIQSGGDLQIRTYERGVEAETLACGTGATAAALAAAKLFQILGPIKVKTKSEELLEIDFIIQEGQFSKVTMKGPANFIYNGVIDIPN